MSYFNMITVFVGLNIDAFAYAVYLSCNLKLTYKNMYASALIFSVFQSVSVIGIGFISKYLYQNYWLGFILLLYVAFNMISFAFFSGNNKLYSFSYFNIIAIAFGLSIDTFIAGYNFYGIPKFLPFVFTFAFTISGFFAGEYFKGLLKEKAHLLGGIIIFVAALKIIFEKLGIIIT